MCGRYVIYTADELIDLHAIVAEAQRRADAADNLQALRVKTGEVFPTDVAAVLTPPAGATPGSCALEARPMIWGYPQFGGRKGVIFNTRLENAASSAFWKGSLAQRRCIIPMSGFYEWQHGGPYDRQRYLFTLNGEKILYLAGVYQDYASAEPGDSPQLARAVELLRRRFSVMTTAPNASLSDVHNRMPVVLRPSEIEEWLFGNPQVFIDRSNIALQRQAS